MDAKLQCCGVLDPLCESAVYEDDMATYEIIVKKIARSIN